MGFDHVEVEMDLTGRPDTTSIKPKQRVDRVHQLGRSMPIFWMVYRYNMSIELPVSMSILLIPQIGLSGVVGSMLMEITNLSEVCHQPFGEIYLDA